MTVTPTNPGNWLQVTVNTCTGISSSTASVDFVNGPGTPPLGSGSVRLALGANGDSFVVLINTALDGVPLSALTALTYSTYVPAFVSPRQVPQIVLSIDVNGNHTAFDQLIFEPVFQDGTAPGDPVPVQGPVAAGTWQTWNAAAGGWWPLFTQNGPPLVTLATYRAAHPAAVITGPDVAVMIGCRGNLNWTGYQASVDNVTMTANSTTTTYDFEVSSPIPAVNKWLLLAAALGMTALGMWRLRVG
ncbi:MAG TPA: hypothetical protein VG323_15150 [Thermoanaerobaculia bacterium]|nr:hypothetical protein [Thermoanaerobaculia bacterium]